MLETLTTKQENIDQTNDIADIDVDTFIDLVDQGPANREYLKVSDIPDIVRNVSNALNKLQPSKEDLMNLKMYLDTIEKVPIEIDGKKYMMDITCSIKPHESKPGMNQLNIDISSQIANGESISLHIDYLYNNSHSTGGREWVSTLLMYGQLKEINDGRHSINRSRDSYYMNDMKMTPLINDDGTYTYNNSRTIIPFLAAWSRFVSTVIVPYLEQRKRKE